MAGTILPEYPAVPGNKPYSIADIAGPMSYTVVTPGTPPTGGQALTPSQFGLLEIEAAFAIDSDNGQYLGQIVLTPWETGRAIRGAILQWIVAATGAEVTGRYESLGAYDSRYGVWAYIGGQCG